MPLNTQESTRVARPRLEDYSMTDMNSLFSNYGQGDGTELRQGGYFQPSGMSNRQAWDEYQAMLREEARRERNKAENERFFEVADKAMSPFTIATDAAGIEEGPIRTAAELVGPGEVLKGGKMIVLGTLGGDFLKKFFMGGGKKAAPNAFNTPALRQMPTPKPEYTLDDVRPYVAKPKPEVKIPDEAPLFDEDAIELRPYQQSEKWKKKLMRDDLLKQQEDLAKEYQKLDSYQERIDRAQRMLQRKRLEAAEDAIELRPYIPKEKK